MSCLDLIWFSAGVRRWRRGKDAKREQRAESRGNVWRFAHLVVFSPSESGVINYLKGEICNIFAVIDHKMTLIIRDQACVKLTYLT